MYDAFIQSYFLTVDVSTTQQCTTAPTMKQAEEVLSPIRTALARSKGPLLKFMTEGSLQNTTGAKSDRVKLASTKKGIENFLTNSLLEVRPMTIDKLQGRRDRVATVDEWLSCDIREDPISALEQGASKNEDYLIVATSSEGTVRNGCGDTIKMELMDILKGEYINPHVSIWYYKLDSIDEVTNPDMWLKANPNLGQTVSYETYQLDVERAEKAPGSRNDILAKRFNIPMEGYTYFFPYEETLPHRHRDYWQMPCALGADLSQGDDFCAFTFLFPMANGFFGVKTRDYITSYTLSKLPQAMRQKYDQFMQEGTLQVFDGTVLDMMQVYDDLDNFIQQNDYDVRCFGYDPYNAKDFVERWCTENAPFGVEKVIQGAKTESVPLGELKKLSEQRKLLFDEALMQFAMGNCIALEDTNGNRKLLKRRSDQKIDAVAAMKPKRVVYVSCNPETLARDLTHLSRRGWKALKIQPVDMFPHTEHVETVCLLSKLNAKQHIEVDIHMDELDLTDAEKKATYSEIKEYVLEHTGLKVSSLYIAQVKQKCGIIERENYNKPKSDDAKQPQCPPDKEKAIKEALKHFGMI